MSGLGEASKRVLVVFHEEEVGGATRAVLRILPALGELGWRFAFWAARPSPLYDHLEAQGLDVHGAPRPVVHSLRSLRLPPGPASRLAGTPAYFRELRAFVRASQPAIVHANSLHSLWEALTVRIAGQPVMLHVHEMLPPGVKGWAAARLARLAGHSVVAVSGACAAALRKAGVRARVVYVGVRVGESSKALPTRSRPVVGTVAAVSRRKGSDLFVEAARLVREQFEEVEFRMIGSPDAPFEAAWARQVLQRAERIPVTHESSADVTAALAEWDIFVLPSRQDPFPTAVLEAMAAGLPVIATNVDGIGEQLTPETGILIEPEDPSALAEAILDLLRSPVRRLEMGAAGRRRVAEEFPLERQAEGIHQAYLAARLACGRGPRASGARAR